MASSYYKPCKELERCDELMEVFFKKGQYEPCFQGHMILAKQSYPLAECQVGYFYLEGLGVEKDVSQAAYWTRRGAEHGDWDAQYNLASFYEEGIGVEQDMEQAKAWYRQAACQGHRLALKKCEALGIRIEP